MNWKKLQTLQCPSCYADLSSNLLGYICTKACGFQIGKAKFDSVVESLYKGKKRAPAMTEEESFEQLQNMGHEEEPEDFSGSPHLNY